MRRALILTACLLATLGSPLPAHDWNGLAIDPRGNLYLVDAEDGQIWKITKTGKVQIFVKGTPRGQVCHHPHHLSLDAHGVLWFASG